METERMRVVVMPFVSHGHISRFLELSKRLSNRGFQIYFCSTPICLEPIRNNQFNDNQYYNFSSSPSSSNNNNTNIQLIDLHLPHDETLPPHYHSTKNIPPHLMNSLFAALDASKPTILDILINLKPHFFIYDLFQPWAPQLASQLNIVPVLFLTGIATRIPSSNKANSTPTKAINLEVNGITLSDRFHQSIERSTLILVKSCKDIQSKFYNEGFKTIEKSVVVGPIVQKPQEFYDVKVIDWLSEKEESSVVFVSLGSENFFDEEEIEEMAKGLEQSGVDFLWVVRFHGESKVKTIDEALPVGFLERTKGKGLVVNWAPQTRVLSHKSIGGFISHCGWNSILESMYYGVPVIAMPVKLDQPYNAKLVVEMGVGVEVKTCDQKLEREMVANSVRRVMVDDGGKEVKKRAKELSERMKENEDEEFDEAVLKLKSLIQQSKHE